MGNFDIDLDFGQVLNDLANIVKGGDDNTSELVLVPISTLILLNKKF